MLEILQARLQQYVNCELPDTQAGFKAEEPEIKLPKSVGSSKKQESSRKISISALLIMPKPLTFRNKVWKILKEMRIPDHLTCLLRNLYTELEAIVRTGLEQQTGSKLGKEYKAVYYYPAYLTYIQSTSCKMLGWINHKLESTLPGEISTTSDMQMILL